MTDDGVRCAQEYNCVRWGGHDLPPQAGIAAYERGRNGLLAAAASTTTSKDPSSTPEPQEGQRLADLDLPGQRAQHLNPKAVRSTGGHRQAEERLMPQANAIIIRIRASEAQSFERLFEAEELPIWDEFTADRKFLQARLTRIQYGSEERDDVALYLIYVEVPSMAEHSAHDSDPRFEAFLQKAREFQPEPPSVFGGDIILQRG